MTREERPVVYATSLAGEAHPARIVEVGTTAPSSESLSQIAVIIPVLDDRRVFDCVDTIQDHEVEVVLISNGSTDVFNRELLDRLRHRAQIVITPEAGIGPAYNLGIAKTIRPWILLMDADCIFEATTVCQLAAGMGEADFIRGRVHFNWMSSTTRLAARARQFTEDGFYSRKITAYSPPLLYRKAAVEAMGGYHFDDRLAWREDREFELRRRAAGLPIAFAPKAVIHHAALTVRADLRSMRSYGRSEAVGRRLGILPREKVWTRLGKLVRTAVRLIVVHGAVDVAGYIFVRRLAFAEGRITEGLRYWAKRGARDPVDDPRPQRSGLSQPGGPI